MIDVCSTKYSAFMWASCRSPQFRKTTSKKNLAAGSPRWGPFYGNAVEKVDSRRSIMISIAPGMCFLVKYEGQLLPIQISMVALICAGRSMGFHCVWDAYASYHRSDSSNLRDLYSSFCNASWTYTVDFPIFYNIILWIILPGCPRKSQDVCCLPPRQSTYIYPPCRLA